MLSVTFSKTKWVAAKPFSVLQRLPLFCYQSLSAKTVLAKPLSGLQRLPLFCYSLFFIFWSCQSIAVFFDIMTKII
jgi:hypothetical protein